MDEKLQKVLANAGYGSRREIEQWIENGRIKVNGKVAKLGDRVNSSDRIVLDGKPVKRIREAQKTRVIIYHKPAGEVSTRHDPEGRPTVFEKLPKLADAIRVERRILISRSSQIVESSTGIVCDLPWLLQNLNGLIEAGRG